jgi:xanthine dehydrogenase accessory factor
MTDEGWRVNDIYDELALVRKTGGSIVLVTVVSAKGSTPRREGAKMLVYPDGKISGTVGGGIREADIIAEAKTLFHQGGTRLMEVDFTEGLAGGSGPVCGGVMSVFMELIGTRRRAVIFGAGHIGYFLHRILNMLEFQTVIIDPRPQLNNEERFAGAQILLRDFEIGIDGLELTDQDAVILVGPTHDRDTAALPSALRSSVGYLGMIGSRRKIKEVFNKVRSQGFSDDDFKRVHSPIGLDIHSESPAEIAVSIAAEIIQHFNSQKD